MKKATLSFFRENLRWDLGVREKPFKVTSSSPDAFCASEKNICVTEKNLELLTFIAALWQIGSSGVDSIKKLFLKVCKFYKNLSIAKKVSWTRKEILFMFIKK